MKAWAETTGHQYLGTIEDGDVLKHYLRKSSNEESDERKHPHILSNEELEKKLEENADFVLIDVREVAEYVFNHITKCHLYPIRRFRKSF